MSRWYVLSFVGAILYFYVCLNAMFFCLLSHTAFWNRCFYFSGPILKIFVEGPTLHFRCQIWKWLFFKKFIEMFIKKKIPFKHTKFNSQFVCNSFIQNAFCNKIIWNLKCILLFNFTLLFFTFPLSVLMHCTLWEAVLLKLLIFAWS